jgi:hypothetical protein
VQIIAELEDSHAFRRGLNTEEDTGRELKNVLLPQIMDVLRILAIRDTENQ